MSAAKTKMLQVSAIEAGTVDVRVSAWGDAGFCTEIDGQCKCATTHRGADSESVSVTVLPSDDTPTTDA